MKLESRIFLAFAIFLFPIAFIYGVWSKDPIGTTALVLSGGLTLLCGSYFSFVSRRIEARPEDRDDGEIADGAGDLGFFSPGSYWPIGVALAVTVVGLGLVFAAWWLIAFGVVAILMTAGGLLFEYYIGQSEG